VRPLAEAEVEAALGAIRGLDALPEALALVIPFAA